MHDSSTKGDFQTARRIGTRRSLFAPKMPRGVLLFLGSLALAIEATAQSAVDVTRTEERQKAQQAVVKEQEKRAKHASTIEFSGEQAFKEKDMRTALNAEMNIIEHDGLVP